MRGHRTVLVAGVAAVALVVGACGDGGRQQTEDRTPSSSASGTPKEPTSTASQGPGDDATKTSPSKDRGRVATRCGATHLAPGLRVHDSSAGSRQAWLVLTNTSDTTCTLYGYGGMQLYDDEGGKVPTRMVRDRRESPRTLSARPGAKVRSALRWSTVSHEGDRSDGPCQPEAATARVTPPDETRNKGMQWSYGPVCAKGKIVQGPFEGAELKPGE